MKQKIVLVLRNMHLLWMAEVLRSLIEFCKSYKLLREFKIQYPDFALPPWGVSYDAYGGLNPNDYLSLGVTHANKVSSLIKKNLGIKESLVICDWGCGPVRVLRHMPKILGKNHSYLGLDYNENTIKWASRTFPQIDFRLNKLTPPLPIEDNSLDVIYSISVFTHLSESLFEDYVNDIFRILKKDGILITTLHGDKNSNALLKDELEIYRNGKFVVRDKVEEGKRTFVSYHPKKFVIKAFNKFTLLDYDDSTDSSSFHQEWWVFKK